MSACSARPAWVKEAHPNIWRFPTACACPRSHLATPKPTAAHHAASSRRRLGCPSGRPRGATRPHHA
eukprot:6987444-Prymnesium_polylepis.1